MATRYSEGLGYLLWRKPAGVDTRLAVHHEGNCFGRTSGSFHLDPDGMLFGGLAVISRRTSFWTCASRSSGGRRKSTPSALAAPLNAARAEKSTLGGA